MKVCNCVVYCTHDLKTPNTQQSSSVLESSDTLHRLLWSSTTECLHRQLYSTPHINVLVGLLTRDWMFHLYMFFTCVSGYSTLGISSHHTKLKPNPGERQSTNPKDCDRGPSVHWTNILLSRELSSPRLLLNHYTTSQGRKWSLYRRVSARRCVI